MDLPSPSGKYCIATNSVEINDSSRSAHLKTGDGNRRILIKIWYPTNISFIKEHKRERLWAQLDLEENMPGALKFYLRKARKKQTNSYIGAAYDISSGHPRVLIYNHGLISFASENTMLMEHLASLGYTVVSLQHRDQLVEFQALQKDQPDKQKKEHARLLKQIEKAAPDIKPKLFQRYFALATNTNRIVHARSQDTAHVINSLTSVLSCIPGLNDNLAAEVVAMLGLSLGGAVATEYEKVYGPLPCVVNMDGGIYGEYQGEPIGSNYLMLYSEHNDGSNSLCLTGKGNVKIEAKTIPNTKHLNFHDIAAYYRSLKWLNVLGSGDVYETLTRRNSLVSEFITKACLTSLSEPTPKSSAV